MANKKVRIELQYDPVKDKEIIDFIDDNGNTRAGFVKFVINHYKNSIEGKQDASPFRVEASTPSKETESGGSVNTEKRKLPPTLGNAFSSNDF